MFLTLSASTHSEDQLGDGLERWEQGVGPVRAVRGGRGSAHPAVYWGILHHTTRGDPPGPFGKNVLGDLPSYPLALEKMRSCVWTQPESESWMWGLARLGALTGLWVSLESGRGASDFGVPQISVCRPRGNAALTLPALSFVNLPGSS